MPAQVRNLAKDMAFGSPLRFRGGGPEPMSELVYEEMPSCGSLVSLLRGVSAWVLCELAPKGAHLGCAWAHVRDFERH